MYQKMVNPNSDVNVSSHNLIEYKFVIVSAGQLKVIAILAFSYRSYNYRFYEVTFKIYTQNLAIEILKV